jgi:hypothetical protein
MGLKSHEWEGHEYILVLFYRSEIAIRRWRICFDCIYRAKITQIGGAYYILVLFYISKITRIGGRLLYFCSISQVTRIVGGLLCFDSILQV